MAHKEGEPIYLMGPKVLHHRWNALGTTDGQFPRTSRMQQNASLMSMREIHEVNEITYIKLNVQKPLNNPKDNVMRSVEEGSTFPHDKEVNNPTTLVLHSHLNSCFAQSTKLGKGETHAVVIQDPEMFGAGRENKP